MASTLAARLEGRDQRRFVGRGQELAFFDRLLVDDPPASVVLLHGPGGVGKSTLLREVARRAVARGWTPHLIEARELAPDGGDVERAFEPVLQADRPLVLVDTYERLSAADAWLRQRLVPSLPERSVVVLAGRTPPQPGWFEGGWDELAVELELGPLPQDDAAALLRLSGVQDPALAAELVVWSDGLPLALALAAEAVRDGATWQPARIEQHPNLVRAILRRVARTELDGGNLDVAAVAAVARCTDARMLRDVLPGVDPDEAEAWLRSRTFAEPVGGSVALHDLARRAMHADLRATAPERERELRRRIADHLHARAVRGEPRLLVDLAALVEDAAMRWGLGVAASARFRPDVVRPEDADDPRLAGVVGPAGLGAVRRFVLEAPGCVVAARDATDALCGLSICVTSQSAPAFADEDPRLGPWLAHARRHHAREQILLWRDTLDLVAGGRADSPVFSILNTAAILRSGLPNPRRSYIPIDPALPSALAFSAAVGARHVPELDHRKVQCHVIDHGEPGMLGAFRALIYREVGMPFPGPPADAPAPVDAAAVRDALRNLARPLELAASPLARGTTTSERAASARARIEHAVAQAFGASPDEQLLRRVLERGYLDPDASHERVADELHVSRATYFRRLRAASQRVADFLVAESG
jgi:hypothetical protein